MKSNFYEKRKPIQDDYEALVISKKKKLESTSTTKLVFSLIIGSILEFFDFSVFAFSLSRLAELFFPNYDQITSYILIFLTFAVGFLARPIGAFIFGYLGDTRGRKYSFTLSLLLMGMSSIALGLLPTYSSIGLWSTVLLTISRFIQGICIGGEYTGALIIVAEKIADKNHRAVWSGIISSCGILGWFFGLGVIMFSDFSFPNECSWRIPFLIGGLTAIVGLYLRRSTIVDEKIFNLLPATNRMVIEKIKLPKKEILAVFCMGALIGILFYSQFVFFNSFLFFIGLVDKAVAHSITSFGLFVYMIALPFAGYFADKTIHIRFILFVQLLIMLFSLIFYKLFFSGDLVVMYILQAIGAIILAFFVAPATFTMVGMFNLKIRYTCVSVSYNLGVSIFGGLTPTIMMLIYKYTNNTGYFAFYLFIAALLSFMSLYILRKNAELEKFI